ncbi:hypothetical protein IV203_014432 [Nitzschia inconspicua]|uniref:Uncharacterized protein n=1 Tax=Nitzschia inconspicua TaxID=303405 RepID=A0A9K3L8N2_9STRA|nr:hypothetical protein IV203_014432 [Nitzschia inconspicua]
MLQRLQGIHPQVWVAIGTFTIIAASAYPVFTKDTREGHDLFSSEKPAAIREAQEAREQEYRRQMLQRRAQLQADQQELEHQLQQQQTKPNGK